jgi:hypothetical protein
MPRTTRSNKSTAPSPVPLSDLASEKAHDTLERAVEETGIEVEGISDVQPEKGDKGKGKAVDEPETVDEPEQKAGGKATAEERLAKLKELRLRMVSYPFQLSFCLCNDGCINYFVTEPIHPSQPKIHDRGPSKDEDNCQGDRSTRKGS